MPVDQADPSRAGSPARTDVASTGRADAPDRGAELRNELARRYREAGWWSERGALDRFADAVGRDPGRLAVVDERGVRLTRGELWQAAGALAEELGRAGVGSWTRDGRPAGTDARDGDGTPPEGDRPRAMGVQHGDGNPAGNDQARAVGARVGDGNPAGNAQARAVGARDGDGDPAEGDQPRETGTRRGDGDSHADGDSYGDGDPAEGDQPRGTRARHGDGPPAGGDLFSGGGSWRRGGLRDVVLVDLPNVVEWQVAVLGCLRAGVVPATVPATTDAGMLAYLLDAVGPRVVVTADGRRGPARVVAEAVAGARSGAGVLRLDGPDERRWVSAPTHAGRGAPAGVDHLMFTSSTTGRPKSVAHSEDTLGAVNAAFTERFGLTEDDALFMPSPLGHSVGAWHGSRLALWNGSPLVLQDRWDPDLAVRLLAEHGCTFTAAATPFLTDLVHVTPPPGLARFGALRTFLCGGAPVPPSLVDAASAASPGTLFSVLWGMTEGGVTTCLPTSAHDKRAHTAGLPLPGLELRVEADGELAMRGPGVCVGYLGQEELFADLLTEDGFFRTGDLAALDDDGYLRVTGRLKDLIIRGGVNVSPLPTEDALAAHPNVRSVAVIGVPDDRLGERIGAVVCTDGATLALDDLCGWLDGQGLARRQWPERLFVVDEMPRTPAGKIRKNVLRERLTGGGR